MSVAVYNHIRAIANLARRHFKINKGEPFWVDVLVTVNDEKWISKLAADWNANHEKTKLATSMKLEAPNVIIDVRIKEGQKEAILCEEIGYKYEG